MRKMEGKRRRGWQRMRWLLDSVTDSMDMNLSKLGEIVEDWGVGKAIVHWVAKSQTWLSNWTMNNIALVNHISVPWDFPGGSVVKNPSANAGDAGDMGSIPGSRRSPGGENGKLLHYSCLENSMDRGAWWATDQAVTKSQMWLSPAHTTHINRRYIHIYIYT